MNVADILSELDDNGFEDTDVSRKVALINDVIQDVCAREAWPFLEKSANITLAQGVEQVALPSDFRAALALVIPGHGVLMPERQETVTKTYLSNAAATANPSVPGLYYFLGSSMYLYPAPDVNYSAILRYLCVSNDVNENSLTADIIIPARHARVITLGALAKLNAMEDDPELAQLFDDQYEARISRMEQDLWKRQYDRPDRIVDLWSDNDYY
jgi:hypothetical protein